MSVEQVSPEEAKRLLEENECVYLDVRTVPEFTYGHPRGALNIPFYEMDAATGRMALNKRFLAIVEMHISKKLRIIVGCQAGPRSDDAAGQMTQAGYRHVRSMTGGFGGITDGSGRVLQEGWSTLGYPIERGDGGPRGYQSLSAGQR